MNSVSLLSHSRVIVIQHTFVSVLSEFCAPHEPLYDFFLLRTITMCHVRVTQHIHYVFSQTGFNKNVLLYSCGQYMYKSSLLLLLLPLALTRLALSARHVNVQLQEDAVHDCHVVQYERKLLSLEARKRRGRHLPHRSAAGRKESGRPGVFCLSSGNRRVELSGKASHANALLVPINNSPVSQ